MLLKVRNSKSRVIDKRAADYFTALPADVLRTLYGIYRLYFILLGYDVPQFIQNVL